MLIDQTQECSIANGSGEQDSSNGGADRGECRVTDCAEGYHTEDGFSCILSTRACDPMPT